MSGWAVAKGEEGKVAEYMGFKILSFRLISISNFTYINLYKELKNTCFSVHVRYKGNFKFNVNCPCPHNLPFQF